MYCPTKDHNSLLFKNSLIFFFKEFCSKVVRSGSVHSSLQNEKIGARLIHPRDASLRLRAFMARSWRQQSGATAVSGVAWVHTCTAYFEKTNNCVKKLFLHHKMIWGRKKRGRYKLYIQSSILYNHYFLTIKGEYFLTFLRCLESFQSACLGFLIKCQSRCFNKFQDTWVYNWDWNDGYIAKNWLGVS